MTGFFSQAAKLHYTGTYRTIRDDFPLNVYKGSAIMYGEELPKWYAALPMPLTVLH